MPERPLNPRVRHANGSVTPVELAYVGEDNDGMHVWSCITPFDPTGDTFEVDNLPPRTSIQCRRAAARTTAPGRMSPPEAPDAT